MTASSAKGPREPVDLDSLPDLLQPMQRWFREHGDLVRFETTGGEAAYMVASPEHAGQVLNHHHRSYRKGYGIDRVRLLLGRGLMVAEGAQWLRHRTMLQPLFHRKVLEGLSAAFTGRARQMRDDWLAKAAAGEAIDVTAETSRFALDAILQALFGGDPGPLGRPGPENPFAVVATEGARDLRFAARFRALRDEVGRAMDGRRGMADPPADLLTLILAARDGEGRPLSRNEALDEVMTLVIAGHETTAVTLGWIWHLLALHPWAQQGLDGTVDQVMREAMRLYPPGWLITRQAVGPDTLGGIPVESGALVFIPLYLLHRHPAHWPDAEAFLPDRFAPGAPARHPFAFLPFGAGPRRCIGEHFALLEMRCHLLEIAAALEVRPVEGGGGPVPLDPKVNLRPREHLRVLAVPRARTRS
jgi:cytochrome P450